jgi:hypothetical protein
VRCSTEGQVVDLALGRLRRPPITALPIGLRRDIRAFFGSYTSGCWRPDGPRRPTFDRMTRQEERAGLLDDAATIGTRTGWTDRLRARGYALCGHRLVRIKPTDADRNHHHG